MDKRIIFVFCVSAVFVIALFQFTGIFAEKIQVDGNIKTFKYIEGEPCYSKDGKIEFYFIGSSTCPYCVQTDRMLKNFVFFRNDTNVRYFVDTPQIPTDVTEHIKSVYDGHVPFVMIGCKYYRIGLGYTNVGTYQESLELNKAEMNYIIDRMVKK